VRRAPWERRLATSLVVIDAVAIVLGLGAVALAGASLVPDGEPWWNGWLSDDLVVGVGVAIVWSSALALSGAYDARSVGVGSEEYRRLTIGAIRALAAVVLVAFLVGESLQPAAVLAGLAVALVGSGALRQVARKQLHRLRAAGRCTRRVLVVGTEASVRDVVEHLRRASFAGYVVVGACVPGGADTPLDDVDVPIVGDPAVIADALVATRAETLAVADPAVVPGAALRGLGWQLEGTGVELIVVPAVTEVAGPRISVRPVAGVPMLHVEEPSLSGAARAAKNVFDRAFALVAAVVLAPLLIAIAVAIRCTSRGPVLFRQTRVGRRGEEFEMLKFRTMVDGAHERVADVRPLVADPDHVLFKLPEDPRITRVGRWLRKHSLDELPQLWNVVTGRMSVVGPRPPLPEEVARYASPVHRRLLVKPGLTGLWQVSGRADLSWDDAVRLDLYYVENWSWVLDALILARTVPAVIRGRGAY
jgi:exopolysaccharide biosynthesis polyprenyl glycosylphosphotransferase